jgi:methionyl-tRNA formyltransferase
VVTRADRPRGRGRALAPPPVKVRAGELGIPVLQPTSIRTEAFLDEIQTLRPDLLAVIAYGRILPGPVLGAARTGGVNVHPSLLPKFRGVAPIPRAVLAGEPETGVTTILMNEKIDAGGALLVERTPIGPRDTTATLTERLGEIGGRLLVASLRGLLDGSLRPVPQDEAGVTLAPRLEKGEGALRWSDSAAALDRRIRAFDPWPGTWAVFRGRRLGVLEAAPVPPEDAGGEKAEPGVVLAAVKAGLDVATGDGTLRLLTLRPEGKRPVDARSFVNGYRVAPGDRLEDGA